MHCISAINTPARHVLHSTYDKWSVMHGDSLLCSETQCALLMTKGSLCIIHPIQAHVDTLAKRPSQTAVYALAAS